MTTPATRDGSSAVRIADGLRQNILRGELPPGSRIRQEDVAANYGASRIPARAALKMLETEGLVTLVANSGAWVSRLSLAECEEMYRLRERVEPLLLRYSGEQLDETALDELEAMAERMAETVSIDEFLRLDRAFHLGSYAAAAASTTMLGETVQRLWNATQYYRTAFTAALGANRLRVTHDEHRMIVQALRDHDLEHAEQVLLGHIRRTRMRLAEHPEIFSDR